MGLQQQAPRARFCLGFPHVRICASMGRGAKCVRWPDALLPLRILNGRPPRLPSGIVYGAFSFGATFLSFVLNTTFFEFWSAEGFLLDNRRGAMGRGRSRISFFTALSSYMGHCPYQAQCKNVMFKMNIKFFATLYYLRSVVFRLRALYLNRF